MDDYQGYWISSYGYGYAWVNGDGYGSGIEGVHFDTGNGAEPSLFLSSYQVHEYIEG